METTLNFEKIWQLFQETDRKFQEMQRNWDHSFQEMHREFQASQQALDRQSKETDRRFQEMQRNWDHSFQEMRREFQASRQDLDRRFRATDKKMKALQELFEGQWGKLMESLVEGDLVRLLSRRGIRVDDTSTRRRGSRNGESYEFDIIAHNGEEIVIVEVKTTLRTKQVEKFIAQLQRARHYLPEFRTYRIFGAVAYLRAEQASDQYAQNQGLFVIRATGDSAAIVNPVDFQPRKFG